jgi:hypothetical protein
MSRHENFERPAYELEERLVKALEGIERILHRLIERHPATAASISQISGGTMGVPFGIVLGNTGQFQVTLSPSNGAITPSTAKWTCDDPSATITPDATGLLLAVATTTADTATSLNLGWSAMNTAVPPVLITAPSVNVPLTGAAGGTVPATAAAIGQLG